MKSRSGATLIEVLVASFVMAIGLLSLLALFPLGAFNMAQAIKDDRVAACVANATAIATARDLRHDSSVMPYFENPAYNPATPNAASNIFQTPTLDGPSHPVYVDPIGANSYLPNWTTWVAGLKNSGIPRASVSFVAGPTQPLRWFTLLDDINFADTGVPAAPSGFTERAGIFSWAYLLRRPRDSAPSVVEMWIVVYEQRSLAINSINLGGDETPYNVTALPSATVVTLQYPAGAAPALRPGSWILDCTQGRTSTGKLTPGNAAFYRVVAVTDNGNNTVDVEVDTPILAPQTYLPAPNSTNPPTRFAVLERVVEVVYKGTNWLP